jgi:hypothetical protein
MAKAPKKSETTKPLAKASDDEKSSAKKPAAKKASGATAGKPSAKKAEPSAGAKKPSPPMTPSLIDTNLAAQSAAQMLVAGVNLRTLKGNTNPSANKPAESSMFKQLKAGANKPHSTTMSNLLDKTHGPGTPKNQPFSKQVGHNQVNPADVNRTGVPRRTSG